LAGAGRAAQAYGGNMAGGTRVAVLGGGMSALTTAFALTEAERAGYGSYDIIVHQLGWRLGGKIADGRNAQAGQRIEEHGLHVWAGFYDNAFTVMRGVFKALPEGSTNTFKTITDAFKPQNYCHFTELDYDQSLPWPYWFEPDADAASFPGRASLLDQGTLPSFCTILTRILGFIEQTHQYYADHWGGDTATKSDRAAIIEQLGRHGIEATFEVWIGLGRAVDYLERLAHIKSHPSLLLGMRLFEHLDEHHGGLADSAPARALEALIIKQLTIYRDGLKFSLEKPDLPPEVRRNATIGDVAIRVVLGILKCDCFRKGFAVLDALDLREFLADDLPCASATDNAILTAGYDYVFGFRHGDPAQPRLSACSAVQAFFRLNAVYKGAFFFKAMSGMGDTVCTPLYEVLKARGVKFAFFHNVTCLEPTADGSRIGTIRIERQAELQPGVASYDPLVQVGALGCWPATPNWAQLRDGERLRAAGIDFESKHSAQQPTETTQLELQVDRDFDRVVLGISVGALAEICRPLLDEASNPPRAVAWTNMVTRIETVRTQALQLWLNSTAREMGGLYAAPYYGPGVQRCEGRQPETMGPICTAGRKPFDTYADMSHVLPTEAWPDEVPASVAYFCSTLPDAVVADVQADANELVRQNSHEWMTSWLYNFWPKIGAGAYFRWDKLYAPSGATGPARLNDQYWRANISPSDRYVLSLPGTLQYRMRQDPADPNGSGYANLYLTGDWTRTDDVNAGCIEAAAMSGIAAAKALSGAPFQIVSLNTLFPHLLPPS
jgi:uncharacterized protein with NAD-binding domain and iron-sulfur cluster